MRDSTDRTALSIQALAEMKAFVAKWNEEIKKLSPDCEEYKAIQQAMKKTEQGIREWEQGQGLASDKAESN